MTLFPNSRRIASQANGAVNVKARVLFNSSMLEQKLQQQNNSSEEGASNNSNNELEPGVIIPAKQESSPSSATNQNSFPEDTWDNVDYCIAFFNMDNRQGVALLELRDMLSDVQHAYNRPNMVSRYLRTQHFDTLKAERMFRDMLAWRIQHQVDDIILEGGNYKPPPEILDKYPGAILKGCDKDGDPVFLSRMGVTDMIGLVDKYGHEDMLRFEIFKRESCMVGSWLPDWERKSGRPVKHILIIEDMQGLSRRLLSVKVAALYGEAMDMDQANYPDAAKKIIIIRAPAVFRLAWTMAKRFFPLFIQQKMEFCGPSDYLKVLEKYMDLDHLPPCIYPAGRGHAAPGQPCNFEGGRIE
eukprot:CAMPEP_0119024168 /NCGR_PEP_ID=MMETSP1176-20130426/31370_1 /TAXON_ID=265551 /ORGANISM="Synedropsis recta cf, Strain CCMP1620" /LENGTH=355 /DNA_ID=CAMNT_0006979389 /DNA_START=51 /DNA_END=1118 /DNA_ORIENTATION=+